MIFPENYHNVYNGFYEFLYQSSISIIAEAEIPSRELLPEVVSGITTDTSQVFLIISSTKLIRYSIKIFFYYYLE